MSSVLKTSTIVLFFENEIEETWILIIKQRHTFPLHLFFLKADLGLTLNQNPDITAAAIQRRVFVSTAVRGLVPFSPPFDWLKKF